MPRWPAIAAASAITLFSWRATALDKQGSAHGGTVDGQDSGLNVTGALSMGVSLYNPSYGARPDNTGRALLRYAAHADVDLIGRRLSIPLDANVFTDRLRKGAEVLLPTEFDAIVGATTTWDLGPGAFELGSRVEHDRPVDRGSFSQSYVDARARYLYSFDALCPGLGRALWDGDINGWLTLGWFAHNPSYAARPDNTGIALLRYGLHTEVSVLSDLFSYGIDATMFTDRRTSELRPSELDLTQELIWHVAPYEVHLAYEVDRPVDRSGLVQQFVYALGIWNFDLKRVAQHPLLHRGAILSP